MSKGKIVGIVIGVVIVVGFYIWFYASHPGELEAAWNGTSTSTSTSKASDMSNYKPADLKWLSTHNDSSLPEPRLFKIPMRIIAKGYSAGHYQVRYNGSPAIDLRTISGGDPEIHSKLNDLAYSGQPFYGYCEYNIVTDTLYCYFVEY